MIHNFFCPIQPTIPGDGDLAVSNIKRCVHEIDHWILVKRLKLNKDETELLVISAKHLPRPRTLCRQWDHPLLSESEKYRCHFLQSFSFQRTYREYLKIIYNISYIRKYLSSNTTEIRIVHAFVSSKLDQCNSVFTLWNERKVKHVQKAAARLITLSRKHEHITPILLNLSLLAIDN